MLGNIEYILRSSSGNGVDAQLQLVMDDDDELLEFMIGESNGALPAVLQQVRILRNRNAHISAMSQAEYQQLYSFVLSPEEEMVKSVLGMILQLKQKIMDYTYSPLHLKSVYDMTGGKNGSKSIT
ncbi:hypothetical protein DRO03_09480 [Methanosarcinales archaeon]|nr:MAG: hypothetical protein DRO03_09480 [Methanosarcinales archaeon]